MSAILDGVAYPLKKQVWGAFGAEVLDKQVAAVARSAPTRFHLLVC